ncbi:hypothetical protein [Alkalihalobacterium alkalinitrilicum]|uniref:hypothetical protein n=1 Tax=Alkalihalobacterium alkalinitrilicum TaxID=427920 RepID=UPI00099501FC|nr:hypothetical protein [Alkalihalobacterium alkalinitrilicum]
MQITNQTNAAQQTSDRTLNLREGEVYRATVKERLPGNEAILQIRGREVHTRWEGSAPAGDRVTIQVRENRQDIPSVRSIGEERSITVSQQGDQKDINRVLRNLGAAQPPTTEVRQAAQVLLDKGVPLTREAVQELQRYLNSKQGTLVQRQQTIEVMGNKRLEVNSAQIRAVHEAIHGRPIGQVLSEISKEVTPNSTLERENEQARQNRERQVNEAVRKFEQHQRNEGSSRGSVPSENRIEGSASRQQATENLRNVEQRLAADRRVSDQTRQVREQVQREPNVQRAVEQVRQQIVNNPAVGRETVQVLDKASRETRQLLQVSQDRMVQSLLTIERQLNNQPKTADNTRSREVIREVREQLGRDQNMQRSVEQLRHHISNQSVDRNIQFQVERVINQTQQIETVARERILKALQNIERATGKTETVGFNRLEASVNSTVQSQPTDQRLSETLQQMQQLLQREANFERVIEQVKVQINQNSNRDVQIVEKVIQATEESKKLLSQGREMAARQQLLETLNQLEKQAIASEQVPTPESNRQPVEQNQYINHEHFQTSMQLNSKDIAVTTITEKLAQAAADFKNLQREISRNLDVANRLIDQFKNQAQHQVKPLLETSIKQLDNAILKSEMMLLTDMKTEKRLMQASSQLAEAKKLLSKGQFQEANRIVQEVKGLVERLQFKPSETKVMHFISNERQHLDSKSPTQHIMNQMNDILKPSYGQEASARQAFEMVRSLGLNRDSELGLMLTNPRDQAQQEANQRNLKTALMTLMRGEEEGSRLSQQANQVLNNITGQQLLSKSDQGNLQSMFFNLPFLLEEQVENLQVFINSRNEGQQVDWENCNLYFLIDTPKLGEVGIMVSVVDRNLSVTLKNNQPMFQTRMEPLVDQCIDNIQEIGYSVNGIKYTKLSSTQENQASTSDANDVQKTTQQPIYTEKGFDFKI